MSKLYKEFFRGFSKVFKGPQHGGKVATIGGVKPKTKFSEATQKFKQNIKAIDQGLDKGIRDFKTENPGRNITDEQMTKVRADKKKEMVGKETKAFLRDKKRKEGIKASKDVKKMIGSGQATKVGGQVFHKGVKEKK